MMLIKKVLQTVGQLALTTAIGIIPLSAVVTHVDGFEGAAIDPFWTVSGPGTAIVTSSSAHSGSQSLKIEASTTFPWNSDLTHDFGSQQPGSVSIFVQTGTLCGCSGAALAINDGAGNVSAMIQRTSSGSFIGRFWPPESPEIFPISISDPLPGWHKLELVAGAGGLTMRFDGVDVFTSPLVTGFRSVSVGLWGGSAGSEYFDDFAASHGAPAYSLCLLYDSDKAVKSGSTLPVKLQLCTPGGANVSSAGTILHATGLTQVSTSASEEVQDAGNANPDNDFRFDASLGGTGGYIFNLKTTGLARGAYTLNFTTAGSPTVYAAPFQVR